MKQADGWATRHQDGEIDERSAPLMQAQVTSLNQVDTVGKRLGLQQQVLLKSVHTILEPANCKRSVTRLITATSFPLVSESLLSMMPPSARC